MNALDPAAGARRSRWTAAPAGTPRCADISRRSRPTSGQTVTVPSSFPRGELPRRLRAPFARNVIPGVHAGQSTGDRALSGLARYSWGKMTFGRQLILTVIDKAVIGGLLALAAYASSRLLEA